MNKKQAKLDKEFAKITIMKQFKAESSPIHFIMFNGNNQYNSLPRYSHRRLFECPNQNFDFIVEHIDDDNTFQVQFVEKGKLTKKSPSDRFDTFDDLNATRNLFISESISMYGTLITFSIRQTYLKLENCVVDFVDGQSENDEKAIFDVSIGEFIDGSVPNLLALVKKGREVPAPHRYGDCQITDREILQIKSMRLYKGAPRRLLENSFFIEQLFEEHRNKNGSHFTQLIEKLSSLSAQMNQIK